MVLDFLKGVVIDVSKVDADKLIKDELVKIIENTNEDNSKLKPQ